MFTLDKVIVNGVQLWIAEDQYGSCINKDKCKAIEGLKSKNGAKWPRGEFKMTYF